METLKVSINGIKNIVKAEFELPLENGVYVLVGENGSGKSTVLLCLSRLLKKFDLIDGALQKGDFNRDSSLEFTNKNKIKDCWTRTDEK